jgi:hypothetical protein
VRPGGLVLHLSRTHKSTLSAGSVRRYGGKVMKPTKEEFEDELAKLVGAYKIQETREDIFLLCLAVVSLWAFTCAALLWVVLP